MILLLTFGAFLLLLAIRVPIAFSMLASAMLYLFLGDVPMGLLVQRVAGGVDSFPLLAVPLFLAAGFLMNTMGITDRIFEFAGALVRHLPGGLGHVNVLSSVIFSGMSGSVVADAGGLGVVEIRAMRKAGYSARFSAAITAASSLIGPIIPPSVVMVIYAFVTEVSLGRMFIAGVIPGLLMALAMMGLIVFMAVTKLEPCPRQPRATLPELWTAFRRAFLPMLAPVILVLGMFLEGIPILMVFGPIFMAVAQSLGIDLVHLGIVFIVSMMIGGISPPVGIALYVVMSIAKIPLGEFMKGIWPFYLAIIAVIVLLVFFPQLSLWLPNLIWR